MNPRTSITRFIDKTLTTQRGQTRAECKPGGDEELAQLSVQGARKGEGDARV